MPSYRIYRLKDHLRQQFRSAPHVSGSAGVKPRDYELNNSDPDSPKDTIVASSPYAAYFALRESDRPLQVGDLLEAEDGTVRICKFVGFEEAQWILPESKSESIPVPETVSA